MDMEEKINVGIGFFLASILAMLALEQVSGAIYNNGKADDHHMIAAVTGKAGEKAGEKAGAHGEAKAKADKPRVDMNALIASADVAKGAKAFGKCKACHTIDKGGKNKTGPNLNGIFNKAIASVDGYKYSGALKGKKGGKWDLAMLDCFLTKPKKCVKGTSMGFAGLKKAKDRANIIAYLQTAK